MAARRTIKRVPLDSFFFSSTGGEAAIGSADVSTDASTEAGAMGAGVTGTGAGFAAAGFVGIDFAGVGLAGVGFAGVGFAEADFGGAGFAGTGAGRTAGTTATGADFFARGVTAGAGVGTALLARGAATGGVAGEAAFLAVGVLGGGDWMLESLFSRLVVSTPLERSISITFLSWRIGLASLAHSLASMLSGRAMRMSEPLQTSQRRVE